MVFVDKKYSKKRERYFLLLNQNFKEPKSLSHAESFLLDAFKKDSELSLAQLRNYLMFHFKKGLKKFKYDYVLRDLKNKNYCWLWYFPTKKALKEKRSATQDLKYVKENIDVLVNDTELLKSKLSALGSYIILLEKDTIKKIKDFNKNIAAINSMNFEAISTSLDVFFTAGTFDSIDTIDFGGVSDGFDGFGGGDFGGAGSSGDW
jgi:hypothetical protein